STNVWATGFMQKKSSSANGAVAAFRWIHNSWSRVRLPNLGRDRVVLVDALGPANVWIVPAFTPSPRPAHWNGKQGRQLPQPPQGIGATLTIAAFGSNELRLSAMGLWNGRSWIIGPSLNDGDDMATIPGTTSAWMVGAWLEKKGLTAEARF